MLSQNRNSFSREESNVKKDHSEHIFWIIKKTKKNPTCLCVKTDIVCIDIDSYNTFWDRFTCPPTTTTTTSSQEKDNMLFQHFV